MSPFSQFLHDLRLRNNLRQSELAEVLGYEQSYISALEVGLKGPPTDEFIERLIKVLSISQTEQDQLRNVARASQRKLVIDLDAPPDIYWLLKDLRDEVKRLSPVQIRVIRDVLTFKSALSENLHEPAFRLKRRRKEEAQM